jgi:hypothetical protein
MKDFQCELIRPRRARRPSQMPPVSFSDEELAAITALAAPFAAADAPRVLTGARRQSAVNFKFQSFTFKVPSSKVPSSKVQKFKHILCLVYSYVSFTPYNLVVKIGGW